MAEPGSALLEAYRLAGYAAIPVLPFLLAYRTSKGKEDRLRRSERYGYPSLNRPIGPLVWIHAASVGETNAILPLVRRIIDEGVNVLFTTVTVTGAATAAANLPRGAFHQFAPIDIAPFVDRFLRYWKPELAIFVESELWPSTMRRLAARRIPQVFANARMSERSFARWQKFGTSALQLLLRRVALVLAQSEGDGDRFERLGAPSVSATGNIKFDVPPPYAEPGAVEEFARWVAGREVFLAASTHEGEEEVVAAAHAVLRHRRPGLLTVIAPRHPVRGPEIRDKLRARGLRVALRSAGELPDPETDIYLADTLGELGIFYRVAPIAFIGGTLLPGIGGHNPIEAVQLQAAILHGPYFANAVEIYTALDRSGRAEIVRNSEELAAALDELFADPQAMRRRAVKAAEALAPFSGALDATMRALMPYVEPLAIAARLQGKAHRIGRVAPGGRR
jgi:3-deoxy-D-manno-octulosonic-acid transferase